MNRIRGYYMWGIIVPYGQICTKDLFETKKKAQQFLNERKREEITQFKNKSNYIYARPFSKVIRVFIEWEEPYTKDEESKFGEWFNKHYNEWFNKHYNKEQHDNSNRETTKCT